MTEQDFQSQVLSEFQKLHTRIDGLEGKVDILSKDLNTFKMNQEDFNQASWTLHSQSFEAINDIRQEVVSPWKLRNHRNAA